MLQERRALCLFMWGAFFVTHIFCAFQLSAIYQKIIIDNKMKIGKR